MKDPHDKRVRPARPRPARSYRELSQQILLLASRAASTRSFVSDVVRILASFTACDELEIWIRRGKGRREGWLYERNADVLRSLGYAEVNDESLVSEAPSVEPESQHASEAVLRLRLGDEDWGRIELRSRHVDFFPTTKCELYEDIAITVGAAVAYQRAQFEQRERVKELSCLYQIARVSVDRDQPIDSLLSSLVAILPPAWQHPDVAAACIALDEHRYATDGFGHVVETLDAAVLVAGQERGHVTVGYTEDRSTMDSSPFLDEEQSLIEAVAREIGQMWEQRQAAEDRRQLQDQLRHADRLATIGQLSAGVAHELNEPLGSILGFAQLAGKVPDLPELVTRDLTRIAAAALHSREIVRKLSLFARQAPAHRALINLSAVVTEGLFLLEARCHKEDIELILELDDDVPSIDGDSGQMTQVLMNLVVNAIQSMPDGGDLRVATSSRDDQVCLTVSDSGTGIRPETLARVFEPFFTTKDVGEGTGLGLSVVHGIVAAHGGTIQVESQPAKGTVFSVEIPVARADGEADV